MFIFFIFDQSDCSANSSNLKRTSHYLYFLTGLPLICPLKRFWEVSAKYNIVTKVIHVYFSKYAFSLLYKICAPYFWRFWPYFAWFCPFFCPIFFSFSPLQIIGHYAVVGHPNAAVVGHHHMAPQNLLVLLVLLTYASVGSRACICN